MASTAFVPAINRSKEIFAEKSSQVAVKLVPQLSTKKQAERKFFAVFVTIIGAIGFLFLLVINTLLAQDAFKLTGLKLEAKLVSDQREALARTINKIAAPESLAKAATDLGMRPSETPIFLLLDVVVQEAKVKNG